MSQSGNLRIEHTGELRCRLVFDPSIFDDARPMNQAANRAERFVNLFHHRPHRAGIQYVHRPVHDLGSGLLDAGNRRDHLTIGHALAIHGFQLGRTGPGLPVECVFQQGPFDLRFILGVGEP